MHSRPSIPYTLLEGDPMSTDVTAPTGEAILERPDEDLGPLPRILHPFVDWVARIQATVHVKLLAGFLVIALLLLLMGVVSIVVLARVNDQVDTLTALNRQTNQARQMIYDVTAQSHYRAMALLTHDPAYTDKVYVAKSDFAANLAEIRTYAIPPRTELFDHLEEVNARFTESSDEVTALYDEGRFEEALGLHVDEEHPISHHLENPLNKLIADSQELATAETSSFRAHRTFLTFAVASFSAVSLLAALTLGAILSWSLIRPMKRVDRALERIADGNFETRVEVPNRDEFGNLTRNLNRTTENLSTLYQRLESLNATLQETVSAKVAELERATRLKRYLSPGLADSILAGERDVELAPSRKFLTTFFSDIRGFTEAAEQMAPEELVEQLNDYLSEMTNLVFKHGGTLDKYLGDALMVFFGDPVPQDDHAARAVRMALEMRLRMTELQERWLKKYDEVFKAGIGISTGWVTVGDIGSSARSDYTVLGKEVNLASRLADRAQAGQILVTERTMRLVDDLVSGKVIDQIALKGINRPIKIYEIVAHDL
jgi:class 3 adenylate cyclase/CHASE3 domain sensor protein